jgi:hypothetical protein
MADLFGEEIVLDKDIEKNKKNRSQLNGSRWLNS